MYLLSPCKICYCFSQLSISCIFWKTFSFMEYCDCPHTPNVLSILCTLHLMALIILCETVKTWTGVPRSLPATLSWSTPSQNPPTITAQQVIVCIEVFWPTNDERKKKIKLHEPQQGCTIWRGIRERDFAISDRTIVMFERYAYVVLLFQAYSTYQTHQYTVQLRTSWKRLNILHCYELVLF